MSFKIFSFLAYECKNYTKKEDKRKEQNTFWMAKLIELTFLYMLEANHKPEKEGSFEIYIHTHLQKRNVITLQETLLESPQIPGFSSLSLLHWIHKYFCKFVNNEC